MNYIYDGSVQGLLCCVFESFRCGEMPEAVLCMDAVQLSMFEEKWIETIPERCRRVQNGIREKLGSGALNLVWSCSLSALPERELAVLRFLHFGFKTGPGVSRMLAHPAVAPVVKARRQLRNEAHLYKEFIRFSEREGILVSTVDPKAVVLPLLADHFALRLRSERFLIHDRTHSLVLVSDKGQYVITAADDLTVPEPDAKERAFQQLWKLYYDTIGIAERRNLRLRTSNMPRRYWANMTEFLAQPDVFLTLQAEDDAW